MRQGDFHAKSLQYLMGHFNAGVTPEVRTQTDLPALSEAFAEVAAGLWILPYPLYPEGCHFQLLTCAESC